MRHVSWDGTFGERGSWVPGEQAGRGRAGLGKLSKEGTRWGKEVGQSTRLLLWALCPFPLLSFLSSDGFSDPGNVLRDSGVDTRPVGLPAGEVSPGDDAIECSVTDQGAPGVTLQGVGDRKVGFWLGPDRGRDGDVWGESESWRETVMEAGAEIWRDRERQEQR